MSIKIVNLEGIGNVSLSKNRRSKNIRMSIKSDGVVLVSYPFFVTEKEALDFVFRNETWIVEQKRKLNARKPKIKHGAEMQTKLFNVVFLLGENNKLIQESDKITITVIDFESEESFSHIKNCLVGIYRYEAKRLLPGRLDELARKYGFSYGRVVVRNNRSTWGSCSSQNNISLNLQMMKLPDYLIDYIILHELVHTEIKNHGREFWKRLDEITGQRAKEFAGEVKKYTTSII